MIAKKTRKKSTHKEYASNICMEDISLLLNEVMEDPFIHHMWFTQIGFYHDCHCSRDSSVVFKSTTMWSVNDKSILSHLTFVTNIALFPYSKFGSLGRLDLYTLPTYFLSSNLSYIHFQMTESWWLKCPMICNDSGWTIHKLDETQRCWMTISSLSPTYLSIISYTCMPLL